MTWTPSERSPDVLTLEEVSDYLRLTARTDRERRRQVRDLVEAGELAVFNKRVGPRRWTVSCFEVMRYIGHPEAVVTAVVAPRDVPRPTRRRGAYPPR